MTSALDESVGAQRRLVADASHELRTPLTSLTVNLELLAENPADAQAPLLAAEALGQAGELTALVNDLVDLARYGQAAFHTEDVRLDLVAERVAARAARRAPRIDFDCGCAPHVVHGDPDALERAVANLVDNAVKWSPPGGRVRISVADGQSSRSPTPAPASPTATWSSSSTASTAHPPPVRTPAPGSAWPSSARSPRPTAARLGPYGAPPARCCV